MGFVGQMFSFGIVVGNPPPPPPDTTPPRITIFQIDGMTVTNAEVELFGLASDDSGYFPLVEWRLENTDGTNDFQTASSDHLDNWGADITGLIGGTNIVRFRVTDGSQNVTEVAFHIFFFQKTPLSVIIDGSGAVAPNLGGKILESGKRYRIAAKPVGNSVFAGWTGDVTSDSVTLLFTMRSNMVVQANFAPNPFRPVAGTYQGAITPIVAGPSQLGGFFRAKISPKGKFTAKVQLGDGERHSFSGAFLADGSYSGSILRKKFPGNWVDFQLQLDITNRTVSGIVTDTSYSFDPTAQLTAVYLKP